MSNTQYKEHPLDESNGNPFKVGDMVRVYDILLNEDLVWEVTNILGDQLALYAKNFRASYHYKQCRLLTKKEPKEYWIGKGMFVSTKGEVHEYLSAINFDPFKDHYKDCNGNMSWVHVREVLDD